MTKRTLTTVLAILAVGGFACSSSTNTPAHDGGDASSSETGGDTAKTDGGDAATAETGGDAEGSETGGDAGLALTPLQSRGKYLVNNVIGCPDCHTPHKMDGSPDLSKFLAGNADFIVAGAEKLPTRNLTNDATGLKNRSDAEIKAMILDGKRPTAAGMEALNPRMPYYVFHNMKSEDADAIVAYLRTVPGVNNEIPRRTAAFDVTAPANYLDPNVIPLPIDSFPERESALRGRYLAAESGLCVECHTQHNPPGPDIISAAKLFQGGENFSDLFATTLMIHPVSKNLTSDVATGLGNWTAADIVKALKEGKAKDGSGICPPMPAGPMAAYGGLFAGDAMDIANYIKSLPPKVNAIVDMCSFPPMSADGGASDGATEAGSDAGADTAQDASGN